MIRPASHSIKPPLRDALGGLSRMLAYGLGVAVLTGFIAQAKAADPAQASTEPPHAVIFSYQRVDEDLYPETNIRLEQFREHIRELQDGDYNIVPLARIVESLRKGEKLPDRTIAITFNGAFRSAYEKAMPVLLDANIPFTIFIPTDHLDTDSPPYISWDELRRLRRNDLVGLGLHSSLYTRLTDETDVEIKRQVNSAIARFRDEMKTDPKFFAYPFGEYTAAYRDIVAASGFDAAFGQQSSVAWSGADMFALPRFPMTESHGGLDRFRMAANALPFPVSEVTPEDPHITGGQMPQIGFTVDPSIAGRIKDVSCFISGEDKPEMKIIGKNRIELRMDNAFSEDRVRINCTVPGPAAAGDDVRWRWFGLLLSVGAANEPKQDDGKNDDEPAQGEGYRFPPSDIGGNAAAQ